MMMVVATLDDDHLLVVAAMPSMMAMHFGARAAIFTVMMTTMHSTIAGLDDNGLRAGDRRDCDGERRNSRNNKTKLLHIFLSFE
ncbi:MAG: hypothetical protein ACJAVZ_004370 [Afipia broomeae]|jgi:hypothetical protein